MRVVVLKKNRSNKRGTPTVGTRDLNTKNSLVKKDYHISKVELGSPRDERKLSAAITVPSMKTKWLKAIRSLKPTSASSSLADRRNGAAGTSEQVLSATLDGNHRLQEYTYKKITACDVCSQILRGHTRQGLRCRICKLNAHGDCAVNLPKRCQSKQTLLRRQKSTSEIESRLDLDEIDKSVESSKTYGDGHVSTLTAPDYLERNIESNLPTNVSHACRAARPPPVNVPILGVQLQQKELSQQHGGIGTGGLSGLAGLVTSALPVHSASISSSSAPHLPPREKLNLRMKSLSLDSSEATELQTSTRGRQIPTITPPKSGVSGYLHGRSSTEKSNSALNNCRLYSHSSPSRGGFQLLNSGRVLRSGSMDPPDEIEKCQSSDSNSPCLSPIRYNQKSHRLLPSNLYVILYNFKARHADELDLKAGTKVVVIDSSHPDWWKGKVHGHIGFFPSKYCMRLNANEKILQVTHNLQVSEGERGDSMTLLRDQIVIQMSDEINGMVMIRSGDNRQGYCPIKYLQEV